MFPPCPSGFCLSAYSRQNLKWIPAYLEFSGEQVAIIGCGVAEGISAANFGKIPQHWEARQILNSGPWAKVLATPEVDDNGRTRSALPGVHYEEYAPPDQAEITMWRPQQVKFVKHNREPLIAVATDTAGSTKADYILLTQSVATMSLRRRGPRIRAEHCTDVKELRKRMPQPPKPWEKGLSSWKAITRWAIILQGLLQLTDVAEPNTYDSQPTMARHRVRNKSIREKNPFDDLDTVQKLERTLRTLEAWTTLFGKLHFLVLHLSRIKVKREYAMARMALLYKKASGRFIPQFLLPTIWKSRIVDWHGRDDAGVRCLLCVIDGRRRHKYVYSRTLITHICRDHLLITDTKHHRGPRSTAAESLRLSVQFQNSWKSAAESLRPCRQYQNRGKRCPATEVNFQRRVCLHCAFRGCPKCDEGFDGSQPNAR